MAMLVLMLMLYAHGMMRVCDYGLWLNGVCDRPGRWLRQEIARSQTSKYNRHGYNVLEL